MPVRADRKLKTCLRNAAKGRPLRPFMISAIEKELRFRQLLRSARTGSLTRLMMPGVASQRRVLLMIMRSVNNDGFDELPVDPAPPLLSGQTSENRIFPNWRFVRLDSACHRQIDPLHTSIAAPHIRRTAAAATPESEFNRTIYYG